MRICKNKKAPKIEAFCRLGEDRTLDPMIKSHVLYQLSYEPFWDCKINLF